MTNLNSFYNSILNIDKKDKEKDIQKIVLEETKKLLEITNDFDGFCKYIATQIECRLKHEISGINIVWLDLDELVNFDHHALIVEYKNELDELKRFIIDPTFKQFLKDENRKLLYLNEWPSEKINAELKENLLNGGMSLIIDDYFNEYINAFSNEKKYYDLEEYLLNRKINKI